MRALIYVVGSLLITAVPNPSKASQREEYRCTYATKVECDENGCAKQDIGSAYILVPALDRLVADTIRAGTHAELPEIRRCDSKGCTPLSVRAAPSGIFVSVIQADGAYFLKIATQSAVGNEPRPGDFVEVASIFLSTLIYTGNCELRGRQ